MRLGAQAVELAEGTRTRDIYGEATIHERHRHRYEVNNQFREQLIARGPRRLGHVPGGPPRRDRRAARPPVVRREPVPPRVQVAADAAGAAVPRIRRRSARAGAVARSRLRRGRGACAAERRPRALPRARRDPEPAGRGAGGRRPGARRARRRRARRGTRTDAGRTVGSTMGNILCRLPGRGDEGTPIFLCAHLDTVPPSGADRAGRRGRRRAQRGGTILGADNKAAVAVMLEAARRIVAEERPARRRRAALHAEGGGRAARRRTRSTARGSRRGSATCTTRRRRSARSSSARRSQRAIEVRFHGRASHAGMYPEEGRSAIAAAARAIADLRLGRIDDQSSANVGLITGGTARNIVPEWCTFEAEARSHDERTLGALVQEMLDAIAFAASISDCTVETEVEEQYRGYRVPAEDEPAVRSPPRALRRRGLSSRRRRFSGGGADANVFNERGLPVRQPRERHGRHPHARRAHRRRRPRAHGRRDARRSSPRRDGLTWP